MPGLSPTVMQNVGKTLGNMHYAGGCLERVLVGCVAMRRVWPPAGVETLNLRPTFETSTTGRCMYYGTRSALDLVCCVLHALEGGFGGTIRRSQLLHTVNIAMQCQWQFASALWQLVFSDINCSVYGGATRNPCLRQH